MEVVAASSAIVGIVVPALHGARVLYADIEKIVNVDRTIIPVRDDVKALVDNLESLELFVKDAKIPQSALLVLENHNVMLAAGNSHSKDGKISWRDKVTLGFFVEDQMYEFRTQLVASKGTITIGLQIAAMSLSAWNNEKMDQIYAEMQRIGSITTKQIEEAQRGDARSSPNGSSAQDMINLFKETLAQANTDFNEFRHQVETGNVEAGEKARVMVGIFTNDPTLKAKLKTGNGTGAKESRVVVGSAGALDMNTFFS